MYCRGFSFDLVTRVWDVFFNEGYKIVYRVALALVKVRAHVRKHDNTISQQWKYFILDR
jgi:Rab-GTPase-TBC domain